MGPFANMFGKNWVTTVGGWLTGGPQVACSVFHICSVGHVGNMDWLGLISGIGAILLGSAAKQSNVTGGSVQQ